VKVGEVPKSLSFQGRGCWKRGTGWANGQ